MPSWMYRMAGNVGNRWAARRNGLREGALLARPFDEVEHRQGPLGVEKP